MLLQTVFDIGVVMVLMVLAVRDVALRQVEDRKFKVTADTNPFKPRKTQDLPFTPRELQRLLNELTKLVNRAEKMGARLEHAAQGALEAEERLAKQRDALPLPPTPPVADDAEPAPERNKRPLRIPEPVPVGNGNDETYRAAVKLIKKGLSDETIGSKVGLPPHEVGLIRRMGV
jgi:TolA-binding protein